ncbi:ribonuclease HII [Albimonas pacifica]|uniref:Ribonuclease HII n=1 Tax=Albimonas pacifica TaxID=1114924 RepID=A0A1I3HNK3_9RHOB|nr:ribonuclease HII [Albimonas pacifica]SFI37080.1 RNase HII [Albimonas pacifica]
MAKISLPHMREPKIVADGAFETAARERLGAGALVCGVDEAGRGPWAGPVYAGAAILDPAAVPEGLADSKALSARRREALAAALLEGATCGVGAASVAEIDELGLGPAADLAMVRAIAALGVEPAWVIVDGRRLPRGLRQPGEWLVKGDARSFSVAAASILAKVARDAEMDRLALEHPGYGWESNRGYGTAAHADALKRLGVTPHHRRSFKPIHNILLEESRATR